MQIRSGDVNGVQSTHYQRGIETVQPQHKLLESGRPIPRPKGRLAFA